MADNRDLLPILKPFAKLCKRHRVEPPTEADPANLFIAKCLWAMRLEQKAMVEGLQSLDTIGNGKDPENV